MVGKKAFKVRSNKKGLYYVSGKAHKKHYLKKFKRGFGFSGFAGGYPSSLLSMEGPFV
jgi:hypothetical protein